MGTTQAKQGVISTGSAEIDKKMGGGIPIGSLTLIEGESDAGKSVLAQQMVWGSLNDGYRATVFTTENTLRSLVNQMASLGLDILDYLLLGRLRIHHIEPKDGQDTERALNALLKAIDNERGQNLVVIDALTSFIAHAAVSEFLPFFEMCKRYCDEGMTIVNVVHSYAFEETTLIRIGSMCDAHVRLRTEQVGLQLLKTIEVRKVKGAERKTDNIICFEVEPKVGMRIIPMSRAKA
jgi:flagellar protein FlaH